MRTTCKTCKSRKDQFFSGLINKFPCTLKLCRNNARTFMLLLRKGVSAYEYMDSMDKFKEKELPTIDKLYSSLINSNISKDDYNHAKKV